MSEFDNTKDNEIIETNDDFENDEFGNYTRYTYYKPEACVVMKVNGKTLVLSGKDAAETQAIYRQLLEKKQ